MICPHKQPRKLNQDELFTRDIWLYSAPEILCNAGEPTAGADIWSVGCVIVEMYTLLPFIGCDLLRKHQFEVSKEGRIRTQLEPTRELAKPFPVDLSLVFPLSYYGRGQN